ncbi:MAG: chemotaxis response regulator protein-glutamate methylesterase [Myxococcales bacterium]|nr:chemotaxis response regulator protein-glutamate methylesterase [Myxococcales bacterium]
MNKARVLVVDDSALMRELLKQMLAADRELEVVGAASDPLRAWDMIQRVRPDVLTLDVEMPGMDGIAFLEKLMRAHPMPVVMVSSLTERGCETTLRALELGAIDFVTKPKLDVGRGMEAQRAELIAKVKNAAAARPRALRTPLGATPQRLPQTTTTSTRIRNTETVIAIGASTGGTEALREVLERMPADAPGVVIVQHMPENFTRHFAERLDRLCAMRVLEAHDGDRILPGHVLLAPGGAQHLEVVRSGAQYSVRLVSAPPVNHHRPSVDTLFRSCATALGCNAVGAILTGMGGDGAQGLLAMRNAGAHTVGQDEATCVVYGMPREAAACGAVEYVSPLSEVASVLLRLSRHGAARA